MTKPANDRRTELITGAGPQVLYTFDFDIETADDIKVAITPVATGVVGTPLTRTASSSPASGQFYVNPAFNTTKEITLNAADLAVGDTVTMWGDRDAAVLVNYNNKGDFIGDNINDEFANLLTMAVENSVLADRAVRLSDGHVSSIDLTLPSPIETSRAIGINEAGDALEYFSTAITLVTLNALDKTGASENDIIQFISGEWQVSDGSTLGDVDGPASSTVNAIARFDGETGKIIKNSTVTVNDTGTIEESTNHLTLSTAGANKSIWLQANGTGAVYLNRYGGSGGVSFGNGSSGGVVAVMDNAGDFQMDGDLNVDGGLIEGGINLSAQGVLHLYGDATSNGAIVRLYNSGDEDTDVDHYIIQANGRVLNFGWVGNASANDTNFMVIDENDNAVNFAGDIDPELERGSDIGSTSRPWRYVHAERYYLFPSNAGSQPSRSHYIDGNVSGVTSDNYVRFVVENGASTPVGHTAFRGDGSIDVLQSGATIDFNNGSFLSETQLVIGNSTFAGALSAWNIADSVQHVSADYSRIIAYGNSSGTGTAAAAAFVAIDQNGGASERVIFMGIGGTTFTHEACIAAGSDNGGVRELIGFHLDRISTGPDVFEDIVYLMGDKCVHESMTNFNYTSGTSSVDPSTHTGVDDWLEVEINGVTRYIPAYNAS